MSLSDVVMHTSPNEKIENFFSRYPLRRFNRRHILIFADEKVDTIYFLVSGLVKQYGISHRGDETILNIFKENTFFPMSHALNDNPTSHIFEAETDIEVRHAPSVDVLKLLRENPDITYDLLRRVYKGTDGLLGRLAQLMSGSARTRLIYEILVEARRFGVKNDDGSYSVHMLEKDLGARSGLTRETVNREIHKLKQDKLIVVERSSLHIPSMETLATHLE